MRKLLKSIYNTIAFKVLKISRRNYSEYYLATKKELCKLHGLSKVEKREIRQYWKKFGITKYNYEWFDLYKSLYGKFDKRFVPDDVYLTLIDPFFNDPFSCKYIDDKNLYDLLFVGIKKPRTIIRKMGNSFMDENYVVISKEDALKICSNSNTNLIIKPTVITTGGHGIKFWDNEDMNELSEILSTGENLIVQEVLKQHDSMSYLHKDSVNTIRIMTMFYKNEVQVLSTLVRMGVNGCKVDNVCSGGLSCGVDSNDCLKEYAFYESGEKIKKHPQGAVFKGYKIPALDQCRQMSKAMATRLVRFSNMVSWDFAVDENGNAVFIEANLYVGGLDFHQMNNGPLFGERTDEILDFIFNKK